MSNRGHPRKDRSASRLPGKRAASKDISDVPEGQVKFFDEEGLEYFRPIREVNRDRHAEGKLPLTQAQIQEMNSAHSPKRQRVESEQGPSDGRTPRKKPTPIFYSDVPQSDPSVPRAGSEVTLEQINESNIEDLEADMKPDPTPEPLRSAGPNVCTRLNQTARPFRLSRAPPGTQTKHILYQSTLRQEFQTAPEYTANDVRYSLKESGMLQDCVAVYTPNGTRIVGLTDYKRVRRPDPNLPPVPPQKLAKFTRWHVPSNSPEDRDTTEDVASLVKEISELGFCCIDTEGKDPPLVIQFGAPSGNAIFIRPAEDIPDEFIRILEDPMIIKYQSTISEDVNQISQLGITTESTTESAAIWKTFDMLAEGPRSGTEWACIQYGMEYVKPNYGRGPLPRARWLPDAMRGPDLMHAVCDVRIHTRGLLKTALVVATGMYNTGIDSNDVKPLPDNYPMLPVVHLMLASHVDLPTVLQNLQHHNWEGDRDPWASAPNPHSRGVPRGIADMTHYFDTWNLIVPVSKYILPRKLMPDPSFDLTRSQSALASIFEDHWKGQPLPRDGRLSHNKNVSNFCRQCGNPSHESSKGKCTHVLRCVYPLCGSKDHMIKVCPILDGMCTACEHRGHVAEDHNTWSVLDLAYAFLKWAPHGLLTSLPFCELSDLRAVEMRDVYWKYSYWGLQRTLSQRLLALYQIPYEPLKLSIQSSATTPADRVAMKKRRAEKIAAQEVSPPVRMSGHEAAVPAPSTSWTDPFGPNTNPEDTTTPIQPPDAYDPANPEPIPSALHQIPLDINDLRRRLAQPPESKPDLRARLSRERTRNRPEPEPREDPRDLMRRTRSSAPIPPPGTQHRSRSRRSPIRSEAPREVTPEPPVSTTPIKQQIKQTRVVREETDEDVRPLHRFVHAPKPVVEPEPEPETQEQSEPSTSPKVKSVIVVPSTSSDERLARLPAARTTRPHSLSRRRAEKVVEPETPTAFPGLATPNPEGRIDPNDAHGAIIFDSHCHIDRIFNKCGLTLQSDPMGILKTNFPLAFGPNFEGAIHNVINPSQYTNKDVKPFVNAPQIWLTFGCHPNFAEQYTPEARERLLAFLKMPNCVAVGECGLDGTSKASPYAQHYTFISQLGIAAKIQKPIVLHVRGRRKIHENADRQMRRMLPQKHKIHYHCYTESYEHAAKMMDYWPNLVFGIVPNYYNREFVEKVPPHRIILETDSPYFVPASERDHYKNSVPGLVYHTAYQVALIKKVPVDFVLEMSRANVEKIYGIPRPSVPMWAPLSTSSKKGKALASGKPAVKSTSVQATPVEVPMEVDPAPAETVEAERPKTPKSSPAKPAVPRRSPRRVRTVMEGLGKYVPHALPYLVKLVEQTREQVRRIEDYMDVDPKFHDPALHPFPARDTDIPVEVQEEELRDELIELLRYIGHLNDALPLPPHLEPFPDPKSDPKK